MENVFARRICLCGERRSAHGHDNGRQRRAVPCADDHTSDAAALLGLRGCAYEEQHQPGKGNDESQISKPE